MVVSVPCDMHKYYDTSFEINSFPKKKPINFCKFCDSEGATQLFLRSDHFVNFILLIYLIRYLIQLIKRIVHRLIYIDHIISTFRFKFDDHYSCVNILFQNCWPTKIPLTKYACNLVFSELLTGRNSVLSKYAGHLVFQKCWPAEILSTKYAGHLVFSELLTGRHSFTKMCWPFGFFVPIDQLPAMQTLRNK